MHSSTHHMPVKETPVTHTHMHRHTWKHWFLNFSFKTSMILPRETDFHFSFRPCCLDHKCERSPDDAGYRWTRHINQHPLKPLQEHIYPSGCTSINMWCPHCCWLLSVCERHCDSQVHTACLCHIQLWSSNCIRTGIGPGALTLFKATGTVKTPCCSVPLAEASL